MLTKLIFCQTSYFTCGIEVSDQNVVVDAAPILAWARGMPYKAFRAYFLHKYKASSLTVLPELYQDFPYSPNHNVQLPLPLNT